SFVLDTNVLLHSGQSIESFQDNDVIIPMAVLEELDKFKKNNDELGRNARMVIRKLDRLRQSETQPGKLKEGIPLQRISKTATGRLFVLSSSLPPGSEAERAVDALFSSGDMPSSVPDNRILRVAYERHLAYPNQVIMISKDINVRLKADALGIKAMDFDSNHVSSDKFYTGQTLLTVSDETITRAFQEKSIENNAPCPANCFVQLASRENEQRTAIGRADGKGKIQLLDYSLTDRVWNISPKNKEQRMALDLLLDPEIRLVTLVGGAGTGKTLLALAAALQLTLQQEKYERILVSRPIIPLGKDIGFLPGSKDAKPSGWMQPIFDNLQFLLGDQEQENVKSSGKRPGRLTPDSLLNSHKVNLEALTYIRGRSIARQFVIVDEAQNLTPHEVKTIISRCGNDTKMILTGDPGQIDNPYLDKSSNGLSYAIEKLKGQSLFGHITLARSERSDLAAIAAKLL
ncbi:MAG: PhoH family protein, partial [Lentisphaeria bacterium]|nr:PhoH family protein [Lentisphaeria bacterium]